MSKFADKNETLEAFRAPPKTQVEVLTRRCEALKIACVDLARAVMRTREHSMDVLYRNTVDLAQEIMRRHDEEKRTGAVMGYKDSSDE